MQDRSRHYVFSFDPMSNKDQETLRGVREIVREFNREHPDGQCRVALSPRGPRPEHAWKYDNKHRPRLRVEDATVCDVYCYPKDPGHRD